MLALRIGHLSLQLLAFIKTGILKFSMMLMARWHTWKPTVSLNEISIHKILLIQFGGIGDMVLITPAIRMLIDNYPKAKISVLGFSKRNCSFLLNYPQVSDIKTLNIYALDMRNVLKREAWRNFIRTVLELRKVHYDLLVSFRYLKLIDWLFFEWLLVSLCRASYRIGVNPPFLWERSIYDHWLSHLDLAGKHFSEFFCDLLAGVGIPEATCQTEFPLTVTSKESVNRYLSVVSGEAKVVCIHPGGARLKLEAEAWDLKNYLVIVEGLLRKGLFIAVLGADNEIAETRALIAAAKENVVDLVGKTSIAEMAAVIKRSKLFIGNDSGPFHVAVAVGTPAIGIFPRTVDEPEYYRYNSKNVHVFRKQGPEGISADKVLEKAKELLALKG